jgi:hypothetical protein
VNVAPFETLIEVTKPGVSDANTTPFAPPSCTPLVTEVVQMNVEPGPETFRFAVPAAAPKPPASAS